MILFLDEITSATPPPSPRQPISWFSTTIWESIGYPDGRAISAAGNRQGDRGVTYTMPVPLANRFSHFEVDTQPGRLGLP